MLIQTLIILREIVYRVLMISLIATVFLTFHAIGPERFLTPVGVLLLLIVALLCGALAFVASLWVTFARRSD